MAKKARKKTRTPKTTSSSRRTKSPIVKSVAAKPRTKKKTTAKKFVPEKSSIKKASEKKVSAKKTAAISSGIPAKLSKKPAKTNSSSKHSIVGKPEFGIPIDEINAYQSEHFETLAKQKRIAQEVLDRHRAALKATPHVTGMHVGLRRRKGKIVWPPEYCIRIHVREKLVPSEHPRILERLPTELDGVSTDVFQQNYYAFDSTATGSPSATLPSISHNPLRGGIAIANLSVPKNWGTLGIPLFRNSKRVFLTNQHVVGRSDATETRVIQPPSDAIDSAVIGRVRDSVMDGVLDAAIIDANDSRFAVGKLLSVDGSIQLGFLLFEEQNGGTAFKIGAATGTDRILGRIKSINASVLVDGQRWMDQQIIVDPPVNKAIILGGDSGSVLMQRVPSADGSNAESYAMVGLVHGGTKQGSLVASHMLDVFKRFKLSLFP